MDSIQQHIEHVKKILDDATISPQMRRHTEEELIDLEAYQKRHPENINDPSTLELYCDNHPNASECKIYDN